MRVIRSSELQVLAEAHAALGDQAFRSRPRLVSVYCAWKLRLRRDAEAERRRLREARQARWAAIQAGEMVPLSIFEATHRLAQADAPSEATFADEWREDSRKRRAAEPRVPLPLLDTTPEPCLPLALAAERLGLREATLRQRTWRGSIRSYRLRGEGIVVPEAEVERLLAEAVAA